MIWTLISVGVLVIGILLMIIFYKLNFNSCLSTIGIALLFIGGISTVIVVVGIVSCHVNQDIKLEKLKQRKAALEYQMQEGQYLGDALGEFNSEIVSSQMYYQNPWTSWFKGEYVMKITPIELSEETK